MTGGCAGGKGQQLVDIIMRGMKALLLALGILAAIGAIIMAFHSEQVPSFDSQILHAVQFTRIYPLATPAAGLAIFGGLCCLGAAMIETWGSRRV